MAPLHLLHRCVTALILAAALGGCIPPDETEDGGVAPPIEAEREAVRRAPMGADCACPAAECDPAAEVCVCEAEGGSGPCVDGLMCLGSPAAGECTRPCDADADCPDGFACIGLQIGNTVTGRWCFAE